jgi:TonB family protein
MVTFGKVEVGGERSAPQFAEMSVVYDPDPSDEGREPPPGFDIGQPEATGYATHDLAGRREQQAREAPQDQPSLSLDPVGTSPRVELPSAPGEAERIAPPIVVAPPPATAPDAAALAPVDPPLAPGLAQRSIHDGVASVARHAPSFIEPPAAPPIEIAIAAPTPPSEAARSAGSGADPAPQSDSESDAFSVLGSAQFRGGRVTVQSGRRVKTRRPKVGLSGMVALAQRTTAQVVLQVSVDASGNVTNVDVARSSGSNDIDQPCRVAMYDWWFEPRKDTAGRAVPDVFQFTISFR